MTHVRSELDTQRSTTNAAERSRAELLKKLEEIKFELQSKCDQLAVKEMLNIKKDEEVSSLKI